MRICHYYYFLDKGFKSQLSVCNGCHHVSMTSFDVNNIAVLNVNGIDEIDFRYIVVSSLELVKKKPYIYISQKLYSKDRVRTGSVNRWFVPRW